MEDRSWPTRFEALGLWLFGTVVAALFAGLPNVAPRDSARTFGQVAEVLGVAWVVWGLLRTRVQLGDAPPLRAELIRVFQRVLRPFWRHVRNLLSSRSEPRHTTIEPEPMQMEVEGGGAKLIVTPGPDTPLEKRVALLESRSDRLAQHLEDQRGTIEKLEGQLSEERQSRRDLKRWATERIDQLAVGGLRFQSIGLGWFLVGGLAQTVPELFSWAFAGLG